MRFLAQVSNETAYPRGAGACRPFKRTLSLENQRREQATLAVKLLDLELRELSIAFCQQTTRPQRHESTPLHHPLSLPRFPSHQ